jgi:hypothetical protein
LLAEHAGLALEMAEVGSSIQAATFRAEAEVCTGSKRHYANPTMRQPRLSATIMAPQRTKATNAPTDLGMY